MSDDVPTRWDDLWLPDHWRDRVGGAPHTGFLVGVLVFAVAWNLIANLWLPGSAWVLANLSLAVVLVVVARRVGLSFEELGLRRDRLGRGLAVGSIVLGIAIVVLAVAVAIPALRSAFDDPAIASRTGWTDMYYIVVRIPLGTVVFEETLFRGVLLALALRRWSVRTAVLLTAALFGLWHVVPALKGAGDGVLAAVGATLGTVAITAAAGALFSWVRLRANSIVASMLAHIATNSVAYLAAVVVVKLL